MSESATVGNPGPGVKLEEDLAKSETRPQTRPGGRVYIYISPFGETCATDSNAFGIPTIGETQNVRAQVVLRGNTPDWSTVRVEAHWFMMAIALFCFLAAVLSGFVGLLAETVEISGIAQTLFGVLLLAGLVFFTLSVLANRRTSTSE